jgi:hypothetical protein
VTLDRNQACTALRGDGGQRVTGLVLSDGQRLPADVVLVDIGMQPAVEWLADSPLSRSTTAF